MEAKKKIDEGKHGFQCLTGDNLVPRVSLLNAPQGLKEEIPWERGWRV